MDQQQDAQREDQLDTAEEDAVVQPQDHGTVQHSIVQYSTVQYWLALWASWTTLRVTCQPRCYLCVSNFDIDIVNNNNITERAYMEVLQTTLDNLVYTYAAYQNYPLKLCVLISQLCLAH